jgi:tetratricopeptide (TPR) repeat protein
MTEMKGRARKPCLLFLFFFLACAEVSLAKSPTPAASSKTTRLSTKKGEKQDDSTIAKPAKDLLLREEGNLKAEALAKYVEGSVYEEDGEMEKALAAYRQVLNVDPVRLNSPRVSPPCSRARTIFLRRSTS